MPDKTPKPNLKKPTATSGSEDESQKIGLGSIYLMIGTALFFDLIIFLINLIPVIGQIISIVIGGMAYIVFFLWFMMKGVKLMTGKRIAAMGSGLVISLIPLVNMLPAITGSVAITIWTTKKSKSGMSSIAKL